MMMIRTATVLIALALLTSLSWGQMRGPEPAKVQAKLNVTALQPGRPAVLAVVTQIPGGLHAQSRTPSNENFIRFDVKITAPAGVEVREAIYPPGEDQTYPLLGTLNVYTGQVVVYVPLTVSQEVSAETLEIAGMVGYQACDDAVCYPPQRVAFSVQAPVVPADQAVQVNRPELFAGYIARSEQGAVSSVEEPAQEGDAAASAGGSSRVVVGAKAPWTVGTALSVAFIAGLLFNVMPCVLPVLPLKAVGFYEVSHHRRDYSFLLGLVFSLGVISVFAVLALLVLVLRWVTWGGIFQQGWFVWSISALLVLLAFSLFGWFTINLPSGAYSFTPRHDTFSGNYLWGGLTAILATPCTAPLLPPLLLWAASQNAAVGVMAMLMVGVGMASPYLLLSAMPEVARNLPRSGPWSELFKQMMGFLLLASAAYFAGGRLIHGSGFWWLVLLVVGTGCLYLVARSVQLSSNARPLAISTVIAVSAFSATLWWTARINGLLNAPMGGGAAAGVAWTEFTPEAFEQARQSERMVLVKFTANWCATCQYIEGTVFQDPTVWEALRRYEVATLKADLTEQGAPGEALLRQLNPAGGIPLTAIYYPGEDAPIVLASVYGKERLLSALEQASNGAKVAANR